MPRPLGLLAELTYRCPLHCPYCSNPAAAARRDSELTTAEWCAVFAAGRELGVLQVHLSGGEPLLRADVCTLVADASDRGLYVNLVTSGVGLTADRMSGLVAAGLDHIQLSVQDASRDSNDRIAGARVHEAKIIAAELVVGHGLPLTINTVLHRGNVSSVGAIADLAVALGATRLELAHTQYYGWAQLNQHVLMPTREQVEQAQMAVDQARDRHAGRLQIVHVVADFYETYPKPCMNGWGSRQMVVTPDGQVLPCPAEPQSQAWERRTCGTGHSRRSGRHRRRSPASAAPPGCASRARPAHDERSTSAAVGARPTS